MQSKDLAFTQFDRLELARGVDAGLAGDGGKEFLAETDRTLGAAVDEVGALDGITGVVGGASCGKHELKSSESEREPTWEKECRNPFRVEGSSTLSQGSSFLATLGWRTQSLRD